MGREATSARVFHTFRVHVAGTEAGGGNAGTQAGMHARMHSCGRINDIVGEWIDVGSDVVDLPQPTLLGAEEMGRRYRGRICFETVVDIQRALPSGTCEDIEAEAKLLFSRRGTREGGFVLSDYGDGVAIGVPDERKWWMFEALKRNDPWAGM